MPQLAFFTKSNPVKAVTGRRKTDASNHTIKSPKSDLYQTSSEYSSNSSDSLFEKPKSKESLSEFGKSTKASTVFQRQAADAIQSSAGANAAKKLSQDETFTINKVSFAHENGLAGREQDIKRLRGVLQEHLELNKKIPPEDVVSARRKSLISITGFSGTGKTVLARQLQIDVGRNLGFFCLGKFDLKSRAEPYTAFAAAFEELADQILARGGEFVEEVKGSIVDAVGAEVHVLLEVMPGLSKLFPSVSATTAQASSVDQKTHQLHFVVRQMVRAVSENNRPLVLVLDDVQWADQQSIQLMEVILTDRSSSLVLVTTSRANEMDDDHLFSRMVMSLQHQSDIRYEILLIQNLDQKAVRAIVADALKSTVEYTQSLADTVHSKTGGNAFFVIQFLKSLVDEGRLSYNFGLMDWIWDDSAVQALTVSDNVADLLIAKIQRLSESCQLFLQVAACLGQSFEHALLGVALKAFVETGILQGGDKAFRSLVEACNKCVEDGLLDENGSKLSFAHDQIQTASYNLIPTAKLPEMQVAIGRRLLEGDGSGVVQHLFLGVDLCNGGSSSIESGERTRLASYNLQAAEKAISKSAFHAAMMYAESGLTLLESAADSPMIQEMRLQLSIAASESSYCEGDFDRMENHIARVKELPGSFDMKFRMHRTRVLSYAAQERFAEGIETALFILQELGAIKHISTSPNTMAVMKELVKTKLLLRKLDQETLSNLPQMEDENRKRAIAIIYKVTPMVYLASPNLFLILNLKAVRWSVKYGVCQYSPVAFVDYGVVLSGVLEDFEGSSMLGEVALALADRLGARQVLSTVSYVIFGFIDHWKNDMRNSLKPLLYGYKIGMETGDVEAAIISILEYDVISMLSGSRKLGDLAPEVEKHLEEIRGFNQEVHATVLALALQTMLNLIGQCADPLVLTGSAMNYDETKKAANESKNRMVLGWIASWQGQVTYLYDDYQLAVDFFETTSGFGKKFGLGNYLVPSHFFYKGLAYVGLAQQGKKVRKNLGVAKQVLKKMKKWLKAGNVNVRHTVQLLEAEIAAAQGQSDASAMFEEAIKTAGRSGYIRDKALAHARAGRFHHEVKRDSYWTKHHIDEAVQTYSEWGAVGVATHLAKKYGM